MGQSKKVDLAAEPDASLTAREPEIALLVARGLRNKAIASKLQCSEGTVKVHLHNIFQKLSIKSRWVLIAHVCDLLSPATSKPGRAFVDAALALDEIAQRLIQVFEFCRVPKHPRPFVPRGHQTFAGSRCATKTLAKGSGSLIEEYPRMCNARLAGSVAARLDLFAFFRLVVPARSGLCHRVSNNWVAKSVAIQAAALAWRSW